MAEAAHFKDKELRCKCGCGQNNMDPEFLEILEDIRRLFGGPLFITSGYRCPEHNAKVSQSGYDGPHTTGRAVDIAVDRGAAHRLLHIGCGAGLSIGVNQRGPGRFIHLDDVDREWIDGPTVWSY